MIHNLKKAVFCLMIGGFFSLLLGERALADEIFVDKLDENAELTRGSDGFLSGRYIAHDGTAVSWGTLDPIAHGTVRYIQTCDKGHCPLSIPATGTMKAVSVSGTIKLTITSDDGSYKATRVYKAKKSQERDPLPEEPRS